MLFEYIKQLILSTDMMEEEQAKQGLQSLLMKMSEIAQPLKNQQIPFRVLMLVGQALVGKTSLMYYLTGRPLLHVKNQQQVYVLRPETQHSGAEVRDYHQTTLCPNISVSYPSISAGSEESGVMVIDMPGFGETRPEYQLLQIYIFLKIGNLLPQAHICQLISQQQFGSDHLRNQLKLIQYFLAPEVLQAERCLSFVITKVEDDDTLQTFDSEIKQLQQAGLDCQSSHLSQDFDSILKKNKYEFRNDQPDLNQGVELRKRIVVENSFYPVNKDASNLLSDQFYKSVIGDSQRQQFFTYLQEILVQFVSVVRSLIKLASLVIRLEYTEVMAFLEEVPEEEYVQALREGIQTEKRRLQVSEINSIHFQLKSSDEADKNQKYKMLASIFARPEQTLKPAQFLLKVLNKFGSLFDRYDHTSLWAKSSSELTTTICQTFDQLSELFQVLSEIKDEQISAKINRMSCNKQILREIDVFFRIWEDNADRIEQHEGYKHSLGNVIGETQYRTVLKQSYNTIGNQWLKTLVRTVLCSLKNGTKREEDIEKRQDNIRIDQQSISKLQNNASTLYILLQTLQKTVQKDNPLTRPMAFKIILVLHRFSLFEEAIMFAMYLCDEQGLGQLIEEGLICGEVSNEFVFSILFKYLAGRKGEKSERNAWLCMNYVGARGEGAEECGMLERKCLRQVRDLRQNIESSSQVHEKYQYGNIDYIRPILDQRDYYCQLIQHRHSAFERSPCRAIAKQTLVQDLLNGR